MVAGDHRNVPPSPQAVQPNECFPKFKGKSQVGQISGNNGMIDLMPTKVVTDLPARDAENRHDGVRIDRDASATLALLQTVKKRPDVRCCSPVDGMAPVADAVNDRPAVSASAVGLAPFEG